MLDVIQRQVELIVMAISLAAVLGAAIGEDTQHRQALCLKERQHPVIERIRCSDRGFSDIELGKGHLGIGVHKGLLVNSAHAFERADVEGILRAQITGMSRLDLATGLIVVFLALQSRHLVFGQDNTFLGHLLLQRLQAVPETGQAMAQPDTAYTAGRDK